MRRAGLLAVGLFAAWSLTIAGCVERSITVTSEPPGAIVWLNDVEVGRTPVTTEFTFYGTYDVRLSLDGYQPIIASRTADAPVYDYPGLDLVSEAVPAKIPSKFTWNFVLSPLPEQAAGADPDVLQKELVQRARDLREQILPESSKPIEKH